MYLHSIAAITQHQQLKVQVKIQWRSNRMNDYSTLPHTSQLFIFTNQYLTIMFCKFFAQQSSRQISCLLARLQTWRAIIFSRVCLWVRLSVCLWSVLLPFNVNRFWRNLVTRTLLWSSLAATIMVQIGCRGTVQHLFENLKKFSKNHRIRISKFSSIIFLCLCLLCIVKKFRLDSNKTDGGDTFWSLSLWWFRQWHCCSSTMLAGIL